MRPDPPKFRNRATIIFIMAIISFCILVITPFGSSVAHAAGWAYFKNKLYEATDEEVTLYVYCAENGSKMMKNQESMFIITPVDIDESDTALYVLANNKTTATIYSEKMLAINITIVGDEYNYCRLTFIHNDTILLSLTYITTLTRPSMPYYVYLPLIKPGEEKEALATEELVLLEVEFQKEILKLKTLFFALLIAIIAPFIAHWMKNRLKTEDFINGVNITVLLTFFFIATILTIYFAKDLYSFTNDGVRFKKHELYGFVFLARLMVTWMTFGLFASSYMVGWKLTELENKYPMLIVSPELQHIELWLVVIYKAEIDGVDEWCIAPLNFGSLWKRLFGHHIKLQRQVYTVERAGDSYQLKPIDIDAPLESGFSFGVNLVKIFPNVILAEDMEYYDDYGKQIAMIMENMTPEEIELKKTNPSLWRKKYGKKYKLKPVKTMRILLSNAHYNIVRVIYDAGIVKRLLAEKKFYEDAYNVMDGAIPYFAGHLARNYIRKKLCFMPQDRVVGDTNDVLEQMINQSVLHEEPEAIDEYVSEEAQQIEAQQQAQSGAVGGGRNRAQG